MAVSAIGQLTSGTVTRDETERRVHSRTVPVSDPVIDDCGDVTTSGWLAAAAISVATEKRYDDDVTDEAGRNTSSYKKNILQRYREFYFVFLQLK